MKCRRCRKVIPDQSAFCLYCGAKQDLSRTPRTRGNGTGSVFRLRNGKWAAVKVIGWSVDENGKVHKRTRGKYGFRSKREAIEALATISTENRPPVRTFREVYEAWLPTHQATKSTLDCYKAARKWFAPLDKMPFGEITVDDLQECLDDCPKGKRTQENMRTLCGLLYKYAIPRRFAELNMAQYLTIHAKGAGDKAPLPDSAVAAVKASVGSVPGADYVLCHCYLGFRPSELLALSVADYDRAERAFVGGAKTDAGKNRTVTVPPLIQPIVDRLTDKPSGPVFCRPDGKQMSLKEYRALFYAVLDQCGVDNPSVMDSNGQMRRTYTPHSCRHTYAMMLKRLDGADKDKLELMGHTSGDMLRHYQNGVDLGGLRSITDKMS